MRRLEGIGLGVGNAGQREQRRGGQQEAVH
jgi:hypothetical protein